MTIDREQLISLVAERTGFDQEQANEKYVELVDRIKQAEAKQHTLEIEGFGTFISVNDRLSFEPTKVLETEINNKYTGMKPIELIGAFKESDDQEVAVVDLPEGGEEEVLDYNDLPEEQQHIEKTEAEHSDSDSNDPPEEMEVAEVTVTGSQKQEELETPEATGAEEKEELESTAKSKVPDVDKTDVSEEKDPLGKILLILAIIIALAVAGWMAYDLGFFGEDTDNSDTLPTEQVQELPETPEGTDLPEQTAGIMDRDGEGQVDEIDASPDPADSEVESNEPAASPVENTPYGLYGVFNKDINSGYFTIVVHSLRSIDVAEEKKQGLVEEGFRTKINEASVNNETYFRVGIGQFSTVEAAKEAVQELPEPYKENNFINWF